MNVMDNANVKAFLKALRLGEGTLDDAGYGRIVGGQMFTDFSKHPKVRVYIPRYDVWSTAAGAYQIIYPTWLGLLRKYNYTDFTPATQDLAAVELIRGRRALDDVIEGRFYSAIARCAKEWASLPGSRAGQRVESLKAIENVYLNNGGNITQAVVPNRRPEE